VPPSSLRAQLVALQLSFSFSFFGADYRVLYLSLSGGIYAVSAQTASKIFTHCSGLWSSQQGNRLYNLPTLCRSSVIATCMSDYAFASVGASSSVVYRSTSSHLAVLFSNMVLRGFESDITAARFSFTVILLSSGKIIQQLQSFVDPSSILGVNGRVYSVLSGLLTSDGIKLMPVAPLNSTRTMAQQQIDWFEPLGNDCSQGPQSVFNETVVMGVFPPRSLFKNGAVFFYCSLGLDFVLTPSMGAASGSDVFVRFSVNSCGLSEPSGSSLSATLAQGGFFLSASVYAATDFSQLLSCDFGGSKARAISASAASPLFTCRSPPATAGLIVPFRLAMNQPAASIVALSVPLDQLNKRLFFSYLSSTDARVASLPVTASAAMESVCIAVATPQSILGSAYNSSTAYASFVQATLPLSLKRYNCRFDCNGDYMGTAAINACGLCVGGKSMLSTAAGTSCDNRCFSYSSLLAVDASGLDNPYELSDAYGIVPSGSTLTCACNTSLGEGCSGINSYLNSSRSRIFCPGCGGSSKNIERAAVFAAYICLVFGLLLWILRRQFNVKVTAELRDPGSAPRPKPPSVIQVAPRSASTLPNVAVPALRGAAAVRMLIGYRVQSF
jgi:hypothetical protein